MTNEELLAQALAPEGDTLAGDDLIAGPRTITITNVVVQKGADRPLIIQFENDEGRPWKPCKTTGRSLATLWGGDFAQWVGRSVELQRDPDVVYAGKKTGGVRIKGVSHIGQMTEVSERLNGKQIKVRKVEPIEVQAKPDKAAIGVAELIERIQASDDVEAIENDPAVVNQRAWLTKNRPELAHKVDTAINAASVETSPFEGAE